MFSSSFYPTPRPLCEHIFSPYLETIKQNNSSILEPSAGKGDIASYIKYNTGKNARIDLIEINEELAKIASSYGRIVDSDFLGFFPDKNYDFIFMNPPFENGDKHLLHAYEIAKNSTIVCILNAETVRNPYSSYRQALKTILDGIPEVSMGNGFLYSSAPAKIEYIENAFSGSDSERKTNVEIAVITITKKTTRKEGENLFEGVEFETDQERSDFSYGIGQETGVSTIDKIKNIVLDFNRAVFLYEESQKLADKAYKIARGYMETPTTTSSIRENVEQFTEDLRGKVWSMILRNMQIEKFMTGKVLDDFRAKMSEQKKITVNEKNISLFIETILHNASNILEQGIVSVFESVTKCYKENRYEPEGWAHNSSYMVGKKFVLPGIMEVCGWNSKEFSKIYRHGRWQVLEDIDKALCYLTGKDFNTCETIIETINNAINQGETKCQSDFFDIVFYKKGTVHFTFRSAKVWADFNIRAAKQKGFLPASMENKWKQKNNF